MGSSEGTTREESSDVEGEWVKKKKKLSAFRVSSEKVVKLMCGTP